MEDQILKEIKELRSLLSQLIGTSDLPTKEKFSKEAITRARAEFNKLSVERGEWIPEHSISSIIKKAPYTPGKFIIEKFGFTNYFTRGRTLYFNRKDLVALKDELKKRNINLGRYIELVEDQEKFKKYLETTKEPKRVQNTKWFFFLSGDCQEAGEIKIYGDLTQILICHRTYF